MTTGRDRKEPAPRSTLLAASLATPAAADAPAEKPAGARMDEEGRRRVGRNLRLLYASVLDQPLPERLTRLVDELAATTANREGSS